MYIKVHVLPSSFASYLCYSACLWAVFVFPFMFLDLFHVSGFLNFSSAHFLDSFALAGPIILESAHVCFRTCEFYFFQNTTTGLNLLGLWCLHLGSAPVPSVSGTNCDSNSDFFDECAFTFWSLCPQMILPIDFEPCRVIYQRAILWRRCLLNIFSFDHTLVLLSLPVADWNCCMSLVACAFAFKICQRR